MKKILFFCFALSLSINGFAQEVATPATTASVEKLMQLMEKDKMMDATYSQMESMFKNVAKQSGASDADQANVDKYMRQFIQMMKEEISWVKMKDSMVKIYAKNFTEKEVLAFIQFYETPAGRAMTQKMPLIMHETMQISQEMAKGLMPKIQAISKNMADEIKAQHQTKAENKAENKAEK